LPLAGVRGRAEAKFDAPQCSPAPIDFTSATIAMTGKASSNSPRRMKKPSMRRLAFRQAMKFQAVIAALARTVTLNCRPGQPEGSIRALAGTASRQTWSD